MKRSASSTPRITLEGGVDSVGPGKGSVGGGRDVAIAGWGFSDKTLVTIGGRPCTQISSKYSEIKCVPPASGSAKIQSSSADIEIFVGAVGRPKLKLQSGSTLRASKVTQHLNLNPNPKPKSNYHTNPDPNPNPEANSKP